MDKLTNRAISLRALEPEDLELLYQWENDSSLWHLSNTLVPFSKYILKQYLENAHRDIYEQKQLRLIIQHNETGLDIGAIDLFDFDPTHRRAGIGILIASTKDRRKGYARESLETLMSYCFKVLHLHQLYCSIGTDNRESLNLFQGVGFKLVGEKKEWIYNGKGFDGELLLQCINPADQTTESQQ